MKLKKSEISLLLWVIKILDKLSLTPALPTSRLNKLQKAMELIEKVIESSEEKA